MANKVLIAANSTPEVWADSADYAGDGGARTAQIDLTALAAGAARQGAKRDMDTALGVANRLPRRWAVTIRIEYDTGNEPVDGETVDLYWAASLSGTAGTANPGGTSGADAAYTGTAGSTLAESLLQLQFIGSMPLTNDAATIVQQMTFITTIPTQYGMPVLVNGSAADVFEGDANEMSITFTPLEEEIQ